VNLTVQPSGPLRGAITVPGDKSITHRALMLSALADGPSRIEGYLDGGDCRATISCLRAMGIEVGVQPEALTVHGRGLNGWREPDAPIDCVRSGTTMRLLAGLLAGQPFYSVLSGAAQLRRRPMDRVTQPLATMGARIWGRDGGRRPPLSIQGGGLQGATHDLPVASAQVKSCLLLAGLYAQGRTVVVEPGPSRDHTERMLRARGVGVESRDLTHTIGGPANHLAPLDVRVPADCSSAAFFIVAALLLGDSNLLISDVGVNPTRTGLLDALAAMGATVEQTGPRDQGGEPLADLRICPQSLRGAELGGNLVPRMIDEFPILALAATQAEGTTIVRDAAELRVKETDRIDTLVAEMTKLGADIQPRPDGFVIRGPMPLRGANVDSHGDHRLGMTLAIAGLLAEGQTTVHHAECIADSFPGFAETLRSLGAEVTV